MTNLAGKPPVGLKDRETRKDPAHMARVAKLPCVICYEFGLNQTTPTQVHHVIHGRHSSAKAPDRMTIPLCEGHHQGQFDTLKLAIHREPARWREIYGDDTSWLNWVTARLEDWQ